MKQQAIVRPVKAGQWKFKQSRYPAMPAVPFKILCVGRTGSGKGCCIHSAILDHYRGAWHKIVLVSRTAHLDHTWKDVVDYASSALKQDQEREPYIFTSFEGEGLGKILAEHADLVKRLKGKKEKILPSLLLCIDDLSDDPNLKLRGESMLSKLFTTGRHMGISVWLNIHSLKSVSPLLRKNASTIVCFKITAGSEWESLKDEFELLAGSKETFQEMYDIAAGKHAPPYSFLVINAHESDPKKAFMARWDTRLIPRSDSDGEE